jgi:hypothetical protein
VPIIRAANSKANKEACKLAASATDSAILRLTLVSVIATPVDIGVLQFFPVERVERANGRVMVCLTLREQV